MTRTYTQAEVEQVVLATLDGFGGNAEWETVSDAVDVYLGRVEREQGSKLDRGVIPHAVTATVLDTIVRDTFADT